MDAKQLLQYAINKMTPSQASKMLENSDVVFGIAGTYAKFKDGGLVGVNGESIGGGIASITSVKDEDEAERLLSLRSDLAANDRDQMVADEQRVDALRAADNTGTTHTVLGGGTGTRILKQVKGQDGVNVVMDQEPQSDRDANIATGGQATAGFHAESKEAEAKRIADETKAKIQEDASSDGTKAKIQEDASSDETLR